MNRKLVVFWQPNDKDVFSGSKLFPYVRLARCSYIKLTWKQFIISNITKFYVFFRRAKIDHLLVVLSGLRQDLSFSSLSVWMAISNWGLLQQYE